MTIRQESSQSDVLDESPELIAFRQDVREFLRRQIPTDIRERVRAGAPIAKSDHIQWQKVLAKRGWLAPNWDKKYGGPGWDSTRRFVFDEEYHLACAPRANLIGLDLLGPVIIAYGTEDQKQRFLPPILSSDEWWCQGFSEPGAGSDLAALSTRAERDGDHYVISGTKLWTSYAHEADWMICLCRTSREEKKQAGISFILVPVSDPNITVSPIRTLAGVHTVNEVQLDDVRVPVSYLVGAEGQAWEITRFLLGHERLVGAGLGPSAKLVQSIRDLLRRKLREGDELAQDPSFRERLAFLELDLLVLKMTANRVLADEQVGRAPGPEVSILKVKGATLQQDLTELLMEVGGRNALVDPSSAAVDSGIALEELYLSYQYFDRRKVSIYGGASEVQRNIIARDLLRA